MGCVAASKGPLSVGAGSFETLETSCFRITLPSTLKSKPIVSALTLDNALSDANSSKLKPLPSALTIGTLFSLPSYVFGVSLKSVNDICPPIPKTAYSSEKFSFTLRKDSRILSPVPSLPCTPMSICCFAILFELQYFYIVI